MKTTIESLKNTISLDLERYAHYANSMREYRPGYSRQQFEHMAESIIAQVTIEKIESYPEIKERVIKLLTSFANWYNKNNSIEASCPSIMISGGANFPVKKKDRQNAARATHRELFQKLEDHLRKIVNWQPKDATSTQEELSKLKTLHASCLECNAYYRKHGTLEGFEFISEKQKRDAYFHIEFVKAYQPFESYNITSIRNKIKRLEANIEAANKPAEDVNNGIYRIETTDERINLYLLERVDADTFAIFRRNGFLWSHKNQCFTRQNTLNAHHSLRRLNETFAKNGVA
ncbi:MAG: hypothetical protein M0Q41_10790 [Bacteroidales bacterium]|nr:hypothetical protein [Acholeplasmataceae bacterium]MCK9449448.1 hypothetical protein [Bacteroidales bacterium]